MMKGRCRHRVDFLSLPKLTAALAADRDFSKLYDMITAIATDK